MECAAAANERCGRESTAPTACREFLAMHPTTALEVPSPTLNPRQTCSAPRTGLSAAGAALASRPAATKADMKPQLPTEHEFYDAQGLPGWYGRCAWCGIQPAMQRSIAGRRSHAFEGWRETYRMGRRSLLDPGRLREPSLSEGCTPPSPSPSFICGAEVEINPCGSAWVSEWAVWWAWSWGRTAVAAGLRCRACLGLSVVPAVAYAPVRGHRGSRQ